MSQQFRLIQNERINKKIFKQFCAEHSLVHEKTVFVFPGNTGHHSTQTTLFSQKTGSGLAELAGDLAGIRVATLSLPTSDMLHNPQEKKIREEAVADLWKAVGYGMSLVLPVRSYTKKYFESALQGTDPALEPSFWGHTETTPSLGLAKYYLQQIERLRSFIAITDEQKKTDALNKMPDYIKDAFNKGKAAIADPTSWFKPLPQPALSIKLPQTAAPNPSHNQIFFKEDKTNFEAALDKWKEKGLPTGYAIQDNKVYKDNIELLAVKEQEITFTKTDADAYQAATTIVKHAKITHLQVSGGTPEERKLLLTELAASENPNLHVVVIDEQNNKSELKGFQKIKEYVDEVKEADKTKSVSPNNK